MDNWSTGFVMGLSQSAEDGAAGIVTCTCASELTSGSFYGPVNYAGLTGPAVKMTPDAPSMSPANKDLLWEESLKGIDCEKFVIATNAR